MSGACFCAPGGGNPKAKATPVESPGDTLSDAGSIPAISTKREPGEPNADNYHGWRGVCSGLSIGVTDGQIREKPLGKPGGFSSIKSLSKIDII